MLSALERTFFVIEDSPRGPLLDEPDVVGQLDFRQLWLYPLLYWSQPKVTLRSVCSSGLMRCTTATLSEQALFFSDIARRSLALQLRTLRL
jgi:hypothetical protein